MKGNIQAKSNFVSGPATYRKSVAKRERHKIGIGESVLPSNKKQTVTVFAKDANHYLDLQMKYKRHIVTGRIKVEINAKSFNR